MKTICHFKDNFESIVSRNLTTLLARTAPYWLSSFTDFIDSNGNFSFVT